MPVEFRADLHIHTCLSPCAELSMTPANIVEKAASLGINIIAISDHNSAENVPPAVNLAQKKGITVIAGMEITSAEEVHILGLFGRIEDSMKMQSIVYESLQPGENDEDAFGMQVVVNEEDEVLEFNKRLLIGATSLSVKKIIELVHEFNGLAIASHIDREGFGIIGQLGFISPDLEFDALEISRRTPPDKALALFGEYRGFPWIRSSDSHRIEDVGKSSSGFVMEHATFDEMRLAFRGIEGRKIVL